jgi:hypothetical protein
MNNDYFTPEVISLKNHKDYNEQWLQERIAAEPKILGLGNLDLRDKERPQPNAGRLDLLLQDPDTLRRYEVEIQLGKTDETHIIRTIEYWDIERKRYPQFEHCAVIVAEEITSRFFNVISLFNGYVPLIAIKLQAIVVNGKVGLIFTKVLDEMSLGVDEDEPPQQSTDRASWEKNASPKTVALADALLNLIHSFAPEYELKYNKQYIGLAQKQNGKANNFVSFVPTKKAIRFQPKLAKSDETTEKIENAELEMLAYDHHFGYYRVSLSPEDVEKNADLLTSLMREAYESKG